MKKKRLEIINSGSGFPTSFRLNHTNKEFTAGISKHLIQCSKYLQDKLGGSHSNVKLSGLFNAYIEENAVNRVEDVGIDFKSLYSGGLIFGDSGGLQILTRGLSISDVMRQNIYKIQAQNSHVAFSLDEMPYIFLGNQLCYLGDAQSKNCGVQAGKNLKEQIKYFKKVKSKSKIVPIVQGPSEIGQRLYVEGLFGGLKKKQIERLECWAIGGVIFASEFQILKRSVDLYNIDGIPPKIRSWYHLLGVTGLRKFLPVLISAKTGLLPIKTLSIDSTKIMKSYQYGHVTPSLLEMIDGKSEISLGKLRTPAVEGYYAKIWKFWKNCPEQPFDDFEDLIEHSCYNSKGWGTTETQMYKQMGVEYGVKNVVQQIFYVFYNIYKYMEIIKFYLDGKVQLSDFMFRYPNLNLLQDLESIDNADDFKVWYDQSVRYMGNGDIQTGQTPECGIMATRKLF